MNLMGNNGINVILFIERRTNIVMLQLLQKYLPRDMNYFKTN